MKAVRAVRAKSSGQRIAFRRTWMTPGLTSGQLLDAGIAVRQSQSRKNLKKAKRPFENYFRSEFRCSMYTAPAVGKRGILSASDAARLMTDAKASWGAPWAIRGGVGLRTRGRRQDALETPDSAFGEDDLDKLIERLVEIRFAWDVEDGVVATSAVPESLYAVTEHCEPYSRERGGREQQRRQAEEAVMTADDGESVVIDGTHIHIGRRKLMRSGHPKSQFERPKWGFTGVDTVPSMVCDAVQGPLLTSSNEPELSLRWKAGYRIPESVAEVLRLRRRVPASSVVGLPPRSAFLLWKSVATTEMEDPALDVALLIVMGEHYNRYAPTECLELLRCARRVALARGLPRLLARAGATSTTTAAMTTSFPLYDDALLSQDELGAYVREAAPFLATKVWARLPEHSQRLLRQRFYLDWFDLLALTLEVGGSTGRLPDGLPNPVSRAPYASKFFFFRHTLGIDEEVMRDLVACMVPPTLTAAQPSLSLRQQQSATGPATTVEYVNEVGETRVRPLVLWQCAALLVRVAAECLGDVLRHVGQSLQRHAELAEEEAQCRSQAMKDNSGDGRSGYGETNKRVSTIEDTGLDLDSYLDRLALPRPQIVGVRPPQGRMRPRKMRIRLLPYEAFPNVFRCLPTPAHRVTRQAEAMERSRRRSRTVDSSNRLHSKDDLSKPSGAVALVKSSAAAPPLMESPFAAVLQQSALAAKHVERAAAALEWASMILLHCYRLVKDLPRRGHAGSDDHFPGGPATRGDANTVFLHLSVGGASKRDRAVLSSEDGAVIAAREALCDRFVQAKVELLMDAIFTHIPWDEVESRIEPLFEMSASEAMLDEAAAEDAGSEPTSAETEVSAEAELLALALEDEFDSSFTETAISANTTANASPSGRGCEASDLAESAHTGGGEGDSASELSQAERDMRAVMAELRGCIESFQISAAELLDAHEGFFRSRAHAQG